MLPGQGPYAASYQPTTQFQMGKLLNARRCVLWMDKPSWGKKKQDGSGVNYSS